MEYRYPHLPFGGLGRSYVNKYGFNFKNKIFEVDKDNLMKANSLLYEQKNITPTIGVIATLDPNKYGDPITLKLESGKTYLCWLDTQGKLGYGTYTSPTTGTTYTIKKGMKFIIRKK